MKKQLTDHRWSNKSCRLKSAVTCAALISLLGFSMPSSIYASDTKGIEQTQPTTKVSGVVLDEKGEPLFGVTVKLKNNSKVGTITDIDGQFTLNAPPNSTLEVSYIGYTTTHVAIKEKTDIKIVLKENTELLDEVVVVGYGVQKKASITGSVASIQSEQLMEVKAANVSNMLAGRLPGLRAVQRSASPGDDGASVDIRGFGKMLVIVDGIERDYTQLDPNDIETISILKDAAAAVYGFKGSNGVLLVTTKKGEVSKTQINYNGYVGFQKVTRFPKLMNPYQYASLYNEAIYNINPIGGIAAYSPEQLEAFRNGTAGTNWWDETMRSTAPQTAHNLSVSGGTEKIKYYLSAGYLQQEGILRSKDWTYKKYNVRSNISVEVAKGFTVDLQLSGLMNDRNRPSEAMELFRNTQMAVPTYSIYANDNPDYWQATGDKPNPVHMSYADNAGYEKRLRREFNSALGFTWKMPWVDGLIAKALVSYDYNNAEWKYWKNEVYEYSYDAATDIYTKKDIRNLAKLDSEMINYYKPTQQYSLNYNKKFLGKHDVGAMLLWEMYNDRQTNVKGSKQYAIGLIEDLDYGDKENQAAIGKTIDTAHEGLVGRFNYAYDSKYLMEFNFRYDGSYKFRKGDRWGFFPGVSLGWRVSEEKFMKDLLPKLDNLKLRASYAKVGDEGDFNPYQYLDGYTYDGNYVLGNDGLTLGLKNRGMANPWLTWYESKIKNIGFDASYGNGIFTVEFDYFQRNRSGLPATRVGTLPTTFGQPMPQENLNSDKNRGFEINIGHNHKIDEFRYSVSANFSSTRIYDDYVEREASTNMYNDWRNNSNGRYKNVRFGKKVISQFQSYEEILNSPIQDGNGNKSLMPGDLKFEDWNNDGIIDSADEQAIGHGGTPRMYYGLNMAGEYKGFDMTIFFQGAAGHNIYVSGDVLDPFIQQGLGNGFEIMTDRWHREDPKDPYSKWIAGEMPAARPAGYTGNRSNNSWSLHNANYLRLKTLEFGYSLPATLLQPYGIEKVRFYMNANNLLTFTSRKGLMKNVDPESDQGQMRYYPQMKTFNFGLNVTF